MTPQSPLSATQAIPLKIFLQKSAFDFHQYDIAKTYIIVNQPNYPARIYRYITLMNSEIILNEGQRPQESAATSKYEAFPAIKIARLAVDKSLHGKGFGTMSSSERVISLTFSGILAKASTSILCLTR
jgi:hypothetical protein